MSGDGWNMERWTREAWEDAWADEVERRSFRAEFEARFFTVRCDYMEDDPFFHCPEEAKWPADAPVWCPRHRPRERAHRGPERRDPLRVRTRY